MSASPSSSASFMKAESLGGLGRSWSATLRHCVLAAEALSWAKKRWAMKADTTRRLLLPEEFDLLFRWFVGIGVDDAALYHSTFSKNRNRLLEGDIAAKFMQAVLD